MSDELVTINDLNKAKALKTAVEKTKKEHITLAVKAIQGADPKGTNKGFASVKKQIETVKHQLADIEGKLVKVNKSTARKVVEDLGKAVDEAHTEAAKLPKLATAAIKKVHDDEEAAKAAAAAAAKKAPPKH